MGTDDSMVMGEPNTEDVTVDLQRVRAILMELDCSSGLSDARWIDKRQSPRRTLNAPCTIRHIAADSGTVATVDGQTREISAEGLGLVSRQHYRRGTAVHISVQSASGQVRQLTGVVVYSRAVRDDWYLTGLKFAQAKADFAPFAGNDDQSTLGTSAEPERPPGASDDEHEPQDSERERALRLLGAVANAGASSTAQISKVTVLSMSHDHVVRLATIPALMRITTSAGRMGLEALLNDPNSEIQVEAAEALGGLGDSSAIGPLKELLNHKKPDVTLRVAAALGRLGDKSGLAVVRRYLTKDNPRARAAARALGAIVCRRFRLNATGIAEARRYLKKM